MRFLLGELTTDCKDSERKLRSQEGQMCDPGRGHREGIEIWEETQGTAAEHLTVTGSHLRETEVQTNRNSKIKQEPKHKTKSQTLEWVQKNPKPKLVYSSGSSPSAPLDLHSPAGPLRPPAAFHCQEEDKRQKGESVAVGDVTADLHGLSNSGEKKARAPGAPTLRTQTVNCSIISRFRSIWAEADACSVAERVRTAPLLKANFL